MKYAAAAISFHENKLTIEIVEAGNWSEALSKHSLFTEDGNPGDISWLGNNMDDAKFEAFNADIAFDIIKIQ